jgi:hypothetical protein
MTTRHTTLVFALSPLAAILLSAGAATHAHAQFSQLTYDVLHTFNWSPPAGTTGTPIVHGSIFEHAWINDNTFQAWGAFPLPQSPGFEPFGQDVPTMMGAMNFPFGGGPGVQCVFLPFIIPVTGTFFTHCTQVLSPHSSTSATACTEYNVAPYGPGTNVQGSFRSAGGVQTAGRGFKRAYAFSSCGISIQGVSSSGTIQWQPYMDSVAGSAFLQAINSDPIEVTATDSSGVNHSQIILAIDYHSDGDDRMNWSNGVLSIDATTARFHARILAPGALNPGELLIDIDNGVVVSSLAVGSLAVPVPPVGSAMPISIPLPNNLAVRYDAAAISPLPVVATRLDFLGGGRAPGELGTPCGTADFDGDGDTGTDADIEAFFACLAGSCCETCYPGGSDFNGDGDVGTDADIESFFRVLAGGPC